MAGKRFLLLALLGLTITQAIFAKEVERRTQDDGSTKNEDNFLNKAGGFLNGLLKTFVSSGGEERERPSLKDIPADAGDKLKESLSDLKAPVQGIPKVSMGRKVRSISMGPGDVSFNDPESVEQEHKRMKRSHLGVGIPDDFEFVLEAIDEFAIKSTFLIGDVIPYRLIISASDIETDVKIEIFSELSGGAYFMVSNVRIGIIGSNFDGNFDASQTVARYDAKFNDGRWDYATIDMGNILNNGTDTANTAASQIEVLFEMQALARDDFVVGTTYRVSVGAMYQSETYITVAQDDLTYAEYTPKAEVDATFTINGPDTLILGTTGVWTITATIFDLYSDIAFDVLAPLYNIGVMTIDSISVLEVGENYQHSAVAFDDGGNFTRMTYENYGNYARLELGTIINSGYHKEDNSEENNTITFQVSVTMLDHDYNDTHAYTIGFTLWKKDRSSVEILWSAQQGVTAENETLPSLPSSPSFTWAPSADTVARDGRFSVVLNMSVPQASKAKYILEASVPLTNGSGEAVMAIKRIRISRIGFNLPHYTLLPRIASGHVEDKTVGSDDANFISWDLGIITNTAQRNGDDDDNIQFEILIDMLPASLDDYSDNSSIPISLGMKHAEEYYWVGRTSIVVTDSPIQYNGLQVPEFSFVNIMGSDAKIYPGSAAVYDLDMNVPAGVDYTDFYMELSTLNETIATESAGIRIVSAEIIHRGEALHLENEMECTLASYGDTEPRDEDNRRIFTVATCSIDRVTSLRDENFARYSYDDSTIRIRIKVVARASSYLTEGDIYWTEVTVNFADSYIYAARSGVEFTSTVSDFYTNVANEVEKWQPTRTFDLMEGETNTVPFGKPVTYNATIGIPYRTVLSALVEITSDNPAIQVCRVKFLNAADALVDYQIYYPVTIKGDVVNATDGTNTDIASNFKGGVSSFSYDYYVDDVMDSYLSYSAIVMMNHRAEINDTYTFSAKMASGSIESVFAPEVYPVDEDAELLTLPEVSIGKLSDQTENINLGGSELYYIDIYIVPGTHHYLDVNMFAPWNSTFYGQYELLEAYVASVGENLACYDHYLTNITVTNSTDNPTSVNNLAVINLGYIPSVGEIGSTVEIEANKLRLIAHVAVLAEATDLLAGSIPFAGTMDIGDRNMWVGYTDSIVLDSSNAANNNENNRSVELHIYNNDNDNVYIIGEVQQYSAVLTLPIGASYAAFTFNLESEIDDEESEVKIFDVVYTGAGKNLLELGKYHEIIPTENIYGVEHMQKVDFKFVRNTDLSGISDYVEADTKRVSRIIPLDNEIHFNFSIRLLDTVKLTDGFKFNITAYVATSDTKLANATGDTEITVESPPEDNAVLTWDAGLINPPAEITRDSLLTFYLNLSLSEDARRFPSSVNFHYRVPYFSNFEDYYNVSVIDHQYTAPTRIKDVGLIFSWDRIRWENMNYIEFGITLDPNEVLEPGLGIRQLSIPVDISYQREDKSNPNTFDDWFTEMRSITFEVFVPENYAVLSVETCQLSASSNNGVDLASHAIHSENENGWSMGEGRGPPLYKNEYIQLSMSGPVKFTGITIYPYNNVEAHRITEFKVQYSRKGIRWIDARDNALEPRIFGVDWPTTVFADNTSVFIAFNESEFIAEHVRILPQANAESTYTSKLRFEMHGYAYPAGTALPTYQCQSPTDSLKDYVLRQILAIPSNLEMYACTIPEPGSLPYCSATDDLGVSWFAMDDNVLNVLGYDSTTSIVYGLARDRISCLRSKDSGHSWRAIECSRFDEAEASGITYIRAKEVPLPLADDNMQDLYSVYGTDVIDSKYWTVSRKALHAFANPANVAAETDDDGQVAYWGDKPWDADN